MGLREIKINRTDDGLGTSATLSLTFDSADDFKSYSDAFGCRNMGLSHYRYLNQLGVEFVRQPSDTAAPSSLTFGASRFRSERFAYFDQSTEDQIIGNMKASGMDMTDIAPQIRQAIQQDRAANASVIADAIKKGDGQRYR